MSPGIKDAVECFEALFAEVEDLSKDGDDKLPYQWSAGECSHEKVAPALFSSEERAIDAWLSFVRLRASPTGKLIWYLKPEILKWQMTMADARQRHRLVSDRYTVKSQFVVKNG